MICRKRKVGAGEWKDSRVCEGMFCVTEDKGWRFMDRRCESTRKTGESPVRGKRCTWVGFGWVLKLKKNGFVRQCCWDQNKKIKLTRVKNSLGPSMSLLPHGMTGLSFQVHITNHTTYSIHEMLSIHSSNLTKNTPWKSKSVSCLQNKNGNTKFNIWCIFFICYF